MQYGSQDRSPVVQLVGPLAHISKRCGLEARRSTRKTGALSQGHCARICPQHNDIFTDWISKIGHCSTVQLYPYDLRVNKEQIFFDRGVPT